MALPALAGTFATALGLAWWRRRRNGAPARDAQPSPPQEAATTPLAAPIPDDIPMTGEEDPLVEVDNPEFSAVVAEFMRSERDARRRENRDQD